MARFALFTNGVKVETLDELRDKFKKLKAFQTILVMICLMF